MFKKYNPLLCSQFKHSGYVFLYVEFVILDFGASNVMYITLHYNIHYIITSMKCILCLALFCKDIWLIIFYQ